jgi:23S rRNA (guanosine2251-2'-O)-methyltransferase
MRDRSTDRPKTGGRPGAKPGTSHPGAKPGGTYAAGKPVAKPGAPHSGGKPVTTHPGAKPATTHPSTKPGTTHEQRDRRERFERARRESLRPDDLAVLYGLHTVKAALENPARRIRKFLATENAARRLAEEGVTASPELVRPGAIDERLAPDAVHQGLYLEADPLPSPDIAEIAGGPVLVLDQITDPHNVGAILRTAAGFDVAAMVTTARHSPEATGALAKAASGALEYVPIVTVQNLARAMAELKERGYLLVGLDSTSDVDLNDVPLRAPLALVLGAEGRGLRQLTRESCDHVGRLELPGRIKSLNVSNAAALALYVTTRRLG